MDKEYTNNQSECKDFKPHYGKKCKFSRQWGSLFECKKIEPLLCPYAYYQFDDAEGEEYYD